MNKRSVILAFSIVPICVLLCNADRGRLGYFSPQTLEYCTQSERCVPVIGLPFFRSRCEYHENELIQLLIDEAYVEPQTDVEKSWETVFHWNTGWKDGFGNFYNVLVRNRDRAATWTLANPETAREYWSEAFRLLRSADEVDVMIGQSLVSHWREFDTPDQVRETIAQIEWELAEQ